MNFVWHAVQGQIYPELARLAAEGLIRQTSTGPRGAKRFEATEEGIAELRRWITDVEPDRGLRNETLLRVFFAYLVDPADTRRFSAAKPTSTAASWPSSSASPPRPARDASERASSLTVECRHPHPQGRIEWAEVAGRGGLLAPGGSPALPQRG